MRKTFENLARRIGLGHNGPLYSYSRDEKFGIMSSRKKPDRWIKTTCGYCSVGCGLYLGVRQGVPVSVKGDPEHPVNYGKLCPKGLSEHYSITAENRAITPLMKSKDRHYPVEWNEILTVITQKVRSIIDRHGPGSFAVISTGQLVTEEFYTLGKLVRLGLQVKHYDGNTTLCMASAVSGYKRSFGSDGPPCSYEDLALSDCLVLIGANIADNHPILTCWVREGERSERRVITIDPRITKTAVLSDLHLQIKPGSDMVLLLGLAKYLVDRNLIDKNFIKNHTTGFNEFRNSLIEYTFERVVYETGIRLNDFLKLANWIASAKRPCFAWTMGINHSDKGTDTVNAVCNLSLLLGKIGEPGTGPFSITGQCNAMGSRECSFTSSMPGYRKFEDPDERRELAELLDLPETLIPTERGDAYPDIIEKVIQGEIKGLWIIGTNPIVSFPNREFVEDALTRLDCLIVQDGFHPTPTSSLAHFVLPAAIWGEKDGTFTNSERRISRVRKACSPPGEALSDFEIFLRLAEKFGVRERLFPGWTHPRDAFEEWRKVSRGRLCDISGISWELLDRVGAIQWPFSETDLENGVDPTATRRLYSDHIFAFEDKKARFHTVFPLNPPEPVDDHFPFILNTGRTVEHWHTRTKTGKISILDRLCPDPWVEIHPRDAEKLRLCDGDVISLFSRRGIVHKIRLKVTATVRPGTVFAPFHWYEKNINNLTLNVFDPISREPNYKQCAVRLELYRG